MIGKPMKIILFKKKYTVSWAFLKEQAEATKCPLSYLNVC